jgi:hypothetical protein
MPKDYDDNHQGLGTTVILDPDNFSFLVTGYQSSILSKAIDRYRSLIFSAENNLPSRSFRVSVHFSTKTLFFLFLIQLDDSLSNLE